MNQHPKVRAMLTCPACGEAKDRGLVLCWPCHRAQKQRNDGGYSPKLEAQLDYIEQHGEARASA